MSAGPNLLAWAKELTESDRAMDMDVYLLAKAILADEEERKRRLESADFVSVGTVDARPEWREQWFNGVADAIFPPKESPTE